MDRSSPRRVLSWGCVLPCYDSPNSAHRLSSSFAQIFRTYHPSGC